MALTVNHPTLKEQVVPTTTVVDSSAVVSMWARAPFRGNVVKWGVINAAVVDSDRTFTMKINATASAPTLVVAASGSAAGDNQSAVPTAGFAVNEGDKLEIASDGAGSTASVCSGFFVIQVA